MRIVEHIDKTNNHEVQEQRSTEQRLLAQDKTLLTLLERIDKQDVEQTKQTALLIQLAKQQKVDIKV